MTDLRPPDQTLGTLLDTAAVGVWTWDIESQRVTWSLGLERLMGLVPGTFAGTFEAYRACVHPDDRAAVMASIQAAVQAGKPYELDHRVIVSNRTRWVTCRSQLIRDDSGRATGMRGVVWDISARKDAEARATRLYRLSAVVSALNKEAPNVASQRELFERACRLAVEIGTVRLAWVCLVGDDGSISETAACAAEDGLSGSSVSAPTGPRALSPMHEAVASGCYAVSRDEPGGVLPSAAFPLRCRGRVIGALGICTSLPDGFDEEELGLLDGLAKDVGGALDSLARDQGRRAALEALRRSEERYRSLVEQATDAIFLTDETYRFVDVTGAACRMLGYTREELLARRIPDILEAGELDQRPLRSIVAGAAWTIERRLLRKDGTHVAAEICAKVLPPGTRLQAFARDIGERKELEAQILMSDRLASLGRLAGGVAHEINNPLAYVAMNLELAEQQLTKLSATSAAIGIAGFLAASRDGAERVRRIVRTLGAFGRGDDDQVTASDVHRALDVAISITENKIRHRARLIKRYAADRAVRANELILGQVFVNLLINSADAVPEGQVEQHEIRVSTSVGKDGRVIVEIRDTGHGISPEVRARIFDPFFSTKPVGTGAGLGLSISHSIVTRFGGEIELESGTTGGTTARVVLLAAEEPAAALTLPPASPRSRHARILVVDDEVPFARVLGEALGHHDVTVIADSRTARALCARESFDCILCDLMMPDLDGPGFYDALRADGHGLEKRIVFMTGGAFTPRASRFLASVPNRCVEKPFSTQTLEDAVRGALEPSALVLSDSAFGPRYTGSPPIVAQDTVNHQGEESLAMSQILDED